MRAIYEKFKNELLNSCVPFWLKNGVDTEYGGLLNCLDITGLFILLLRKKWIQCKMNF